MSKGIKGWDKCTLLTKPEQSGKTFLMLQKIVEDFSEEPREDGKKNINFIFCANNLLLVLQTSERVNNDKDLNELQQFKNIDTGEIYIEFSSSNRTSTNTSDSVYRKITKNKISNVICCTNGIRCIDIFNIINDINETSHMKDIFHFNIWFDEADKYIKLIKNYMIPFIEKYENISFYPISATPEDIIKYFKEIKIWPIQNPTLVEYHGWNDNTITLYDNNICQSNEDFVEHILLGNPDDIKPNTKWFIPANNKIESHVKIKDICRKYGFATMIINGEGIKIYMPDGKLKECMKDDTPDKLIPKLYKKYKLYKYPFAITGYQCISRGISISSKTFMLSHSIMPLFIKNKSELSQIAGRMKGNQKGWDNYNVAQVFCSEYFNIIAKEVEEKTIKLAKVAFEEEWETVTLEKFKTVEKYYYYYQHDTPFSTYKKALEYLSTQEKHLKYNNNKIIINVKKMEKNKHCHETLNGYVLTSKLHKVKDIKSKDKNIDHERLTIKTLNEMSLGSNLSEPKSKNASYIIYPVYDNLDTPHKDVKFYVRHTIIRDLV